MVKRYETPLADTPDEKIIHAEEDSNLVKLGVRVAQFIEGEIHKLNPDAPPDAILCKGCVSSILMNAVQLLATKTDAGFELSAGVRRGLQRDERALEDLADDGINVDDVLRDKYSFVGKPDADAILDAEREKARQMRDGPDLGGILERIIGMLPGDGDAELVSEGTIDLGTGEVTITRGGPRPKKTKAEKSKLH